MTRYIELIGGPRDGELHYLLVPDAVRYEFPYFINGVLGRGVYQIAGDVAYWAGEVEIDWDAVFRKAREA